MPYDGVTIKTYRNEILMITAPCLAKMSYVIYFGYFDNYRLLRYVCQMNANTF
jgi:hypothetical protein